MSELTKKMALEAGKPRRIAVYAHLTVADTFIIAEVSYSDRDEHWQKLPPGEEREQPIYNHVRISHIMTVVCRPVDEDTITQNAVASLDKQAQSLAEEYNDGMKRVLEMKRQLLALTYTSSPSPDDEPKDPPTAEFIPRPPLDDPLDDPF